MSMDPFYIEAVVRELRTELRGAAVSKVHQPGPHQIVLRLWNGRENLRLLLCTAPTAGHLCLTEARYPNPQHPPRFSQLLRARLTRLLEIERVPGERIVHLLFAGQRGEGRWTLVLELTGTRGNLVLLDDQGVIVDALQRSEEKEREILPGRVYRAPERPVRFDLATGLPEIPPDVALRSWLLEHVSPMTALAASDICAAVEAGISPSVALENYRRRWLAKEFSPSVGHWRGEAVLVALLPEHVPLDPVQIFDSPSKAAEAYYAGCAGDALFGVDRGELERAVRKGRLRLEKRLAHIEAEGERAQQYERQRQLGDLLLGNLHQLRKGMTQVVLDDWYAEPPGRVTIPLDPALSPQENAEAYFRRHRKGKRGREHTERRRVETAAELEWLAGVVLALEEAQGPADLAAVRQELEEARLLTRSGRAADRRLTADPRDQLRRGRTPGGFAIFWGKNNTSNDLISKTLTGADDLWFHAHNLPGCHLVLKREPKGKTVPEADILYAAAVAAGHCRGKAATKVEVMVTEGKQVHKPKGARPGLVTVERYRTVLVAPLKNFAENDGIIPGAGPLDLGRKP